MRAEIRLTMATAMLLAAASTTPAGSPSQFKSGERYLLPSDETHSGDLYVAAADLQVNGGVDGDLLASGARISIDGTVDGDLFFGGGRLDLRGRIGDSARLFVGEAVVGGTIDGDLIVFGGQLNLLPDAHVTGDLVMCGGRVEIEGRVDGGLTFLGGEIKLHGTIGSDARLEADQIQLKTGSEIRGDLRYASRKELRHEEGAIVLGTIEYDPKMESVDDRDGMLTGWAVWFWLLLGSIVVGAVLLALQRRNASDLLERIDREGLLAGVVGFVTFLVFPMAAVLAMLPLITIPLVGLATLLYACALYLAKLPVALWLGRRLLGRLGRSEASPFVALIVGLVLLYLLFAVPYLGRILWLVTAWLGLGSIILAARTARLAREA